MNLFWVILKDKIYSTFEKPETVIIKCLEIRKWGKNKTIPKSTKKKKTT